MMAKEIPVKAGRAAVAVMALATALGFAAPALAQDRSETPPPSFATTRNMAPAPTSGGTRYLDMGAETNVGFVLEQRGGTVLLQIDGSKEIMPLVPIQSQRGDTMFVDLRGQPVLKVTKAGNVISYLHKRDGAPADPAGRVAPLSAPAMTASLDSLRAEAKEELSRLAGHDVTVWGTQAFSSNEAMAAEALSLLVLGVKNANGYGGRAAQKIEKVTIRRAKAPDVTFKDGELIIDLNPGDPWNGRITHEEVTKVLTASRSSG
jgi:hypothetical protein